MVGKKNSNLGKFLLGSIEEMEDKVIDLLCCVADHEVRCDAKEAGKLKNTSEGGKIVVYKRRRT